MSSYTPYFFRISANIGGNVILKAIATPSLKIQVPYVFIGILAHDLVPKILANALSFNIHSHELVKVTQHLPPVCAK